ncbi:unnamed protein product [Rotaria sordida]|uniref:Uncharacterized protein n=1 Tax=Rotaria sordida TaxID=392033 RepID=A0A818PVU5_9BILA|nr:unnamed protein product [Rotaria sordida]CAF0999377.1 unnamed protein product [Rotaria sordida]CAF3583275.1 unnamed protein product [Rotaria sordida]CAF3629657.1 unnamed protein product [Rotaria sordida]
MASETLAMATSYHKPTPSSRKPTLETTKVRSEDELLKFFLHGSYDVQRGHMNTCQVEENDDKIVCIKDELMNISSSNIDDKKAKSRCMFEETYMINISVKQPDTKPSSKQIDVRIEKTPSDIPITNKKIDNINDDDGDEISSIFDEDENDEIDSVIFNEMNSSTSETRSTKLTLADMINKTLTTIPTSSCENLNKLNNNNNWFIEQQNEIKTRPTNEHMNPSKKTVEHVIKTPSPHPLPKIIQTSTLTTNINEDKKLFEYLDYLETKEETNQPIKSSTFPITTKISKPTPSINKVPLKQYQQEPIPIIDLEQLCRSLTVNDLKDECIRKKIYELKILIDERHKKHKSQIPLVKPRKDNLPILIAMPPIVQQPRRRVNVIQPTTLLQSKTVNLQVPYNSNYHDTVSNYTNKYSSNNQHYTRHQTPPTKYRL